MYAAGSQGTWLSIDGQNGTRGYVSASIPAPANSGGISTVRIEGSGGLAQIGPIKQGSSFMSNCGGPNLAATMIERKTPTGTYICTAIFGSAAGNARFGFVYGGSPSGWRAYVNGNIAGGPYSLGFSSGRALSPAEFNGGSFSMSGQWGPSGQTPWQRTDNSGTSYTTIVDPAAVVNDGGWILQAPPSPFFIYR